MTRRATTEKIGLAFLMTLTLTSCQRQMHYTRWSETTVTPLQPSAAKSNALKDIDLTRIGQIAPKGRVQDKEFNQLEVVDQLLEHDTQSIPFLIGKLDDETRVPGPVHDYWSNVTVGDVALLILPLLDRLEGERNNSWSELGQILTKRIEPRDLSRRVARQGSY